MAKMLSCFKFHNWRTEDGRRVADMTIRKWHPEWWLLLAGAFISTMRKYRLIIAIGGREFVIGAKD